MKHSDQKLIGKEGICLACIFRSQSVTEGCQGGDWSRSRKGTPLSASVSASVSLSLHLCLSLCLSLSVSVSLIFLIQPTPTSLRMALPVVHWARPHQWTVPHRHGPSWGSLFLVNLGFIKSTIQTIRGSVGGVLRQYHSRDLSICGMWYPLAASESTGPLGCLSSFC